MAPQHPDEIREQLLGFLLESLEPRERLEVEEALRNDPALREELARLRKSLKPLSAAPLDVDPPENLVEDTCQYVAQQGAELVESQASYQLASSLEPASSRWSMADFAVAAGVFLSATLLLFPAVQHSRALARRTQCQDNLRQVGIALDEYSQRHDGYVPKIHRTGPLAFTGAFVLQLLDSGCTVEVQKFQCASLQSRRQSGCVKFPTSSSFRTANDIERQKQLDAIADVYASNMGYYKNGGYCYVKLTRSAALPLLCDLPDKAHPMTGSRIHGVPGQNVLFADGRSDFVTICVDRRTGDNLFMNNFHEVAGGQDGDDTVMGPPISLWVSQRVEQLCPRFDTDR